MHFQPVTNIFADIFTQFQCKLKIARLKKLNRFANRTKTQVRKFEFALNKHSNYKQSCGVFLNGLSGLFLMEFAERYID